VPPQQIRFTVVARLAPQQKGKGEAGKGRKRQRLGVFGQEMALAIMNCPAVLPLPERRSWSMAKIRIFILRRIPIKRFKRLSRIFFEARASDFQICAIFFKNRNMSEK
jgi:hypothetical protein